MNQIIETQSTGPNVAELKRIVGEALEESRRSGASSAEAGVSVSTGLSVNVRLGEVEKIEHTRDRGLGVTVYLGHKKGSASTTDFSDDAVRETVQAACGFARYTAEDECGGLADAQRMATEIPDLDLYHPWELSAEEAIELALTSENAARSFDERITNSDGASVSHQEGEHVYGNTHGFLGGFPSTRHGISCSVIGEDDAGMQTDYWYSVARRADALQDPAEIGRMAAMRTVRRLGGQQIPSGTLPVLFNADIASGLFRHFIGAISGGNLYRRSSFLLDKLNERVFPESVRIHEQPHLRGGLGSSPYDSEGVATRSRDIVNGGVLRGYVLSSYSARKLGLETTGNAGGVHNLTVEPAPDGFDLDGLLDAMGTGLLVTELMGMGVNTTTGDYSRGASGFWVDKGKVRHPVEEITIAGNLADMLLGIRQIGTDVDLRGNIRCGSVLIDAMTVAGA